MELPAQETIDDDERLAQRVADILGPTCSAADALGHLQQLREAGREAWIKLSGEHWLVGYRGQTH